MTLAKNINKSPVSYRDAAVVAHEAGQEMLSRLQLMALQPQKILNMGCDPDVFTQVLKQSYPAADIIALNVDVGTSGQKKTMSKDMNAQSLALADQSVDFIFANFILPWQEKYEQSLSEWARVLKPDGLLMLTALGPVSFTGYLQEMQDMIIPKGIDMHDLGDLIMQAGLAEPVLDVCSYTLAYRESDKLLAELIASHMLEPSAESLNLSPNEADKYTIHFEVIHAHAFAPSITKIKNQSDGSVVSIPVSEIKYAKGE